MKLHTWEEDQKKVEGFIGNLLRTGVVTAAIIVLVGGVLFLSGHATTGFSYHQFKGEPAQLRSVMGIFHDAVAMHSLGLIQLGILLLIATPISRVVFSVFAFAEERDWMYVSITLVVLALLLYSLLARH
jgi:uncharacterized membrane protein